MAEDHRGSTQTAHGQTPPAAALVEVFLEDGGPPLQKASSVLDSENQSLKI